MRHQEGLQLLAELTSNCQGVRRGCMAKHPCLHHLTRPTTAVTIYCRLAIIASEQRPCLVAVKDPPLAWLASLLRLRLSTVLSVATMRSVTICTPILSAVLPLPSRGPDGSRIVQVYEYTSLRVRLRVSHGSHPRGRGCVQSRCIGPILASICLMR
jgi:hypothetical protein